jgi:hypothetical protein
MIPITMYECPHCKKLFKTPNKHCCRRDPAKTNCYSCEHWGHQFYFDKSYFDNGDMTCEPEESCKMHETSYVDSAFELMREKGWHLNCPEYERKGGQGT